MTAAAPVRDRVFISYSHRDAKWLQRLQVHFAPFERAGKILRWDDTMIAPGAKWQQDISRALASAKVAVLLVSAEFLASDFIVNQELPHLLSAAENDGVVIIPLILGPCAFDAMDDLSQFQSVNPPTQPLAALNRTKREQVLAKLAKTVSTALASQPKTTETVAASTGRLCNVPARNPLFCGREELLRQIEESLNDTRRVALSGLAGIGKTEAVIEYLYRHRLDYSVVMWIKSDSRQQIHASLIGAARFLDLPEWNSADQNVALAALSGWLTRNSGWLAVFDDADDLGAVKEFFPNSDQGGVIITTRMQAIGAIAKSVDIGSLTQDEGTVLLLRRAKICSSESDLTRIAPADYALAQRIAGEMDGLPLALDQAGAYIEETGCGLEGYCTLWSSHRVKLLAERASSSLRNSESVAGTWLLSFSELAKSQPQSVALLRLLAFLHPDAVPEEVLSNGSALLGPDLAAVVADSWRLNEVIRDAIKFSLLRRDAKSKALRMHRLLQAVVRDSIDSDEQAKYAEQAVRIIEHSFPEAKFVNWERCERLSAHAQVCATTIENYKLLQPYSSRLLHEIGYYLYQRGRYAEAAGFIEQALSMRQALYGTQHPDYALTLDIQGQILRARGEFVAAEQKLDEAFRVLETDLSARPVEAARVMCHLASLKLDQNQLAEAEALFQKALAIVQASVGEEHAETAQIANNLAAVYFSQGNYPRAHEMFERTLVIREKILPSNHPSVAQAYNNLAAVCSRQKLYGDAERLYKKALSIRENSLGADHPHVAETLYNLGLLYLKEKKCEVAEDCLERARKIREQTLGFNHPRTADVLGSLAEVRLFQKKVNDAEEFYTRSLCIRESALGKAHPDVGYSLMGLADVEQFRGNQAHVEILLRRALDTLKNGLGAGHPDVIDCQAKLNASLLALGREPEANTV